MVNDKLIIISHELFTRKELERYEQCILDNKHISEHKISQFFANFPKFLSIGGYKQLVREVLLYKTEDESAYRVDFFRKKYGEEFWDIVELKKPDAPFVVQRGKHWKFGSIIEAGINQSIDYKAFLDNPYNRLKLEEHSGITSFKPDILIIGGRDDKRIDPIELKKLKDRYKETEIKSYDDLYYFALDNYKTSLYVVPALLAPASSKNKKINATDFYKWIHDSIFNFENSISVRATSGCEKVSIYITTVPFMKRMDSYSFEIEFSEFERTTRHMRGLMEKAQNKFCLPSLLKFNTDYEQAEKIISELGGKEKAIKYCVTEDTLPIPESHEKILD